MKRKKVKDIIMRAVKTFLQGFTASLCINGINDMSALKSALIGALAGGISALMNTIVVLLENEGENNE